MSLVTRGLGGSLLITKGLGSIIAPVIKFLNLLETLTVIDISFDWWYKLVHLVDIYLKRVTVTMAISSTTVMLYTKKAQATAAIKEMAITLYGKLFDRGDI